MQVSREVVIVPEITITKGIKTTIIKEHEEYFLIIDGVKYKFYYAPDGSERLANSKQAIYRFLIEKLIGRKLAKGEVVHHKDKNHFNNDLDNLELVTIKKHQSEKKLKSERISETLNSSETFKEYRNDVEIAVAAAVASLLVCWWLCPMSFF